jgi:hypothetical protein
MSSSIRSLYVINKAGGLVYTRDFTKNAKRTANDNLVLAGTLHGCVPTPRRTHTEKETQIDARPCVCTWPRLCDVVRVHRGTHWGARTPTKSI